MMRYLLLLALLGSAFALPKSIERIVGGEPTTVDKYPYMANMQWCFMGTWCFQACGGSLLTNNLILSAAHCYEGDSPSSWEVVLGTSSPNGAGGIWHSVSQIVMHPQYEIPTSLDNDVALLRLSRNAVFSSTVQPARIPYAGYNLPDGTAVTAIGHGTLWSSGPSPTQLQHVEVYTINQQLCKERYDYLRTLPGFERWPVITDGMLCAGILDVGGKDACQGDSGGPLAYDGDIIVGVTSWGRGCADEFYPGVNARVSHYTDWIVANQ